MDDATQRELIAQARRSLIAFVEKALARPGILIGGPSLHGLSHMIAGYEWALSGIGVIAYLDSIWSDLDGFVRHRFAMAESDKSAKGWIEELIDVHSGDERAAFETFRQVWYDWLAVAPVFWREVQTDRAELAVETSRAAEVARPAREPFRIEGRRVRQTEWVQTDRFVVKVEVEGVVPVEDPGDVCYEPHVVELLRDIHEHAEAGDVAWLQRHGRVYQHVSAA